MKHTKLLQKLCSFSDHHQHKMACIITKRNKIVSMGYNKIKTHPASLTKFKMLHAEVSALIGLSYEESKGCTAHIYRQRRDGSLALAKPCEGCELALRLAGIKRVFYTDSTGWKEELV